MSAEFEQFAIELLKDVQEKQAQQVTRFEVVERRMAGIELKLDTHSENSESRHKEMLTAFPAGDTDGHRRYHESVIEWRELRNRVVRECLVHAAKAGFLAGFAWLLYAIWVSIKMEIFK